MSHRLSPLAMSLALCCALGTAQATNFPVTEAQKDTASRVAQAGVPLSELAPNAPDSYTVKSGDTLWAISTIFLKTPWRWPELWGMNRQQIANPHLIYPGQTLFLVKRDGRATLEMAADVGGPSSRLQPRVRSSALGDNAVASIPQHLIEPFLNEAVVFDTDALATAPRIVAAPENRVLMTQGDLAYVRGITQPQNEYRVFRQATPLRDPKTNELLGYEARFSATAQLTRLGGKSDGKDAIEVPATITLNSVRNEVGVGDRLAPVPPRVFSQYVPHAPDKPISGHIVSIYGDALTGGQNQIVALNKGTADGMERGHVLTMWRAGQRATDRTTARPETIQLPDEQHGVLFVFQTFQRVSYALIISVKDPVTRGDRFTQP
jgi:LysM repeat protein